MLKSLLLLIAICFMTIGCGRSPEGQLIFILEKKYANRHVDKKNKDKAIKELKVYLDENGLSEKTYPKVEELIHKINDGHVVLYQNDYLTRPHYVTDLEFYPGSSYVKSCSDCSPPLLEGKYEILEVNEIPLAHYLDAHYYSVAASSKGGREFRLFRTFTDNPQAPEIRLKVKSVSGQVSKTSLSWLKKELDTHPCVSGERLNEKTFKLNILSLWCDDRTKPNESRQQILTRFKEQFDQVASQILQEDFIILDLRENGGGADQEVEYVLNSFSNKSLFMYKYQYLNTNKSGIKKWIAKFISSEFFLWNKVEFQYSNPDLKTKHTFYDNKMVTLISAGCFSSCEGLASSIKNEERSQLIGTTTHGGAGDPVVFPLKGSNFSVNVTTCLTWQKDGKLFEGQGVEPHMKLEQTFTDNSDSILSYVLKKNAP